MILPAGSKDIPIGRLLCIIVPNAEDVAKFKDYVAPATEAAGTTGSSTNLSDMAPEEPLSPKVAPIKAPEMTPQPPPARITGAPSPPRAAAAAPPPPGGNRPFASPAAKRVAAERGIDLFHITTGSGMDGMITARDVESFVPAAAPVSATAPALGKTAAQTGPAQPTFRTSGRTTLKSNLCTLSVGTFPTS